MAVHDLAQKTLDKEKKQEYPVNNVSKIEKLHRILKSMVDEAFYGELLIKFEAGNIVLVKRQETMKL